MRESDHGYGRKGWGSIDGNPGLIEGFGGIDGLGEVIITREGARD